MKISSLFSDRSSFETVESIKNFIVNSKNYQSNAEAPERSNALLIFNISSQHTWLVATEKRLYCILDDIRKPKPHINWSMKREDIIQNNRIAICLRVKDKNRNTGLIDIGEKHKGWLFSKKLFLSQPIETMIKKILERSMLLHEFK